MARGDARAAGSRAVGASALLRRRPAVGRAARQGRAEGRDRRAGGADVAASDHGRARALRLLDHRALVLPRLARARRSGDRSSPQAARRRRPAACRRRGGPARRPRPVRRPQELERQAPPRQPRRSGRGAARPRARAVLSHAAPLHARQRPRQAPAPHPAPDGRGRARRDAPRRARDPPLRGGIRQRPVALGLPPRVAQGSDVPRRVGDADPVRRARRSLAPGLPSPVVSVRDRRGDRARPRPGVPEARPAARGA